MKLEFSRQIFEKSSNIKFLENQSEVFCMDGWMDRRTEMTQLIIAFLNFANTLEN